MGRSRLRGRGGGIGGENRRPIPDVRTSRCCATDAPGPRLIRESEARHRRLRVLALLICLVLSAPFWWRGCVVSVPPPSTPCLSLSSSSGTIVNLRDKVSMPPACRSNPRAHLTMICSSRSATQDTPAFEAPLSVHFSSSPLSSVSASAERSGPRKHVVF